MSLHTAPDLRRTKWSFAVIVVLVAFFTWAYLTVCDSSKLGIAVFGSIACIYFFYIWKSSAGWAKSINIVGTDFSIIMQNGKETRFSLNDVQKVRFNDLLGGEGIILQSGDKILGKIHSQTSGYDLILQLLANKGFKVPEKDPKTLIRQGVILVLVTLLIGCVCLVLAIRDYGNQAIILYIGAISSFITAAIFLWFIIRFRNKRSS